MKFFVPTRTRSITNMRSRWTVRKQIQRNRHDTAYAMREAEGASAATFREPITVRLTRHGAGKLDDDNLRSALKGVRDEIAARLGIDDGEVDRLRFEYCDQVTVGRKDVGVFVEIEGVER